MTRDGLESQIRCLQADLSANTSAIGDWKIVKIYEARMQGLEDPYDFTELVEKRQACRDKINEYQRMITYGEYEEDIVLPTL